MAATPALVAQRMADLLQCFPSAASVGVQWLTLARKYEEKHGAPVRLEELGHTSALAAATALLWDVVRIVDKSDADNPVVAVEDAIALTPDPSGLASWPSLYKVLCDVACKEGEDESTSEEDSYIILLSKVKPLLQRHWHSSFDELGLAYFTQEGATIKLKKMKHLLEHLLRWRSQRLEWKADMASACSTKSFSNTALDEAVEMELILTPSKTRNDLVLRCVRAKTCSPPLTAIATAVPNDASKGNAVTGAPTLQLEVPERQMRWADMSDTEEDSSQVAQSSSCKSSLPIGLPSDRSIEEELAFLRSENAKLRYQNHALESQAIFQTAFIQSDQSQVQQPDMFEDCDLDDPSEPPPPAPQYRYLANSPACSSRVYGSGSITPFSKSSISASGCATPTAWPMMPSTADAQCKGVGVQMMPMWFQIIPTGVVQETREVFGGTGVPSWFAMGHASDNVLAIDKVHQSHVGSH